MNNEYRKGKKTLFKKKVHFKPRNLFLLSLWLYSQVLFNFLLLFLFGISFVQNIETIAMLPLSFPLSFLLCFHRSSNTLCKMNMNKRILNV